MSRSSILVLRDHAQKRRGAALRRRRARPPRRGAARADGAARGGPPLLEGGREVIVATEFEAASGRRFADRARGGVLMEKPPIKTMPTEIAPKSAASAIDRAPATVSRSSCAGATACCCCRRSRA